MGISSAGVGSGLPVESIISKLMTLERQPLVQLQAKQSDYNSRLSAYGKIKSAVAALQTAAAAISTPASVSAFKSAVTDTTVASATTSSSAVAGSYSLEVQRLATFNKLVSGAGVSAAAGGSLSIEIGSVSGGNFTNKSGTSAVTVNVGAGATLGDVATAINATNSGVSASVINGSAGPQLVMTSQTSGAGGLIRVTGSGGLSGLSYDPVAQSGGLTQKDAGQDAIVLVDGVQVANAGSNTITNAVTGVTLNLTKTNTGSPTQLTITNDTSTLTANVNAFVKAYNDLNTQLKSLTSYNSTSKTAAVLNGDQTVTSISSQLRGLVTSLPTGSSSAYPTFSSLGIAFQTDGSMKVDSTKLQNAINADYSSVVTTINAYGSAFNTMTTAMNNTTGIITQQTKGINDTLKSLSDRSDSMTRMLSQVEARYRAQYTALDTLMGKLQSNSSYLTQQLAALSKSTA
ncbi:flagellar filament capping protein FliD [Rhodocyclus tenuis]|uniref:Flagellar hook-associated protein 2 n=2 Tax=Rhodocyclus TaxID=1064 RepID=A0A6L5JWX3_RHOTE|nr:flagellar filament capping protein FliD [Rhodocyclus gracilis]MQY51576.1 flagellar filament capping protein FliD [Rhodocyclus gracilis]MRD73058.1 flagellar filament capping protein FliD [Rhodocyclus gracilis]NJA89164.1 flagellar filament capping protein FliD [Rhodocyclus gracilis]